MPLDLFFKAAGTIVLGLFVFPAFMIAAVLIGAAGVLILVFPTYPLELTAAGLALAFVAIGRSVAVFQQKQS